jgi:hypothetical protein
MKVTLVCFRSLSLSSFFSSFSMCGVFLTSFSRYNAFYFCSESPMYVYSTVSHTLQDIFVLAISGTSFNKNKIKHHQMQHNSVLHKRILHVEHVLVHLYSYQPMHLLLLSHPTRFGIHYTIIITDYAYDSWWSWLIFHSYTFGRMTWSTSSGCEICHRIGYIVEGCIVSQV